MTAGLDSATATGSLGRKLEPWTDVLRRVREALSGADHIRAIARGLATFSRVEDTRLVAVDIQSALEHALRMAGNEIKYRAKLITEFAPSLPQVLASEGRLAQVFLNLLVNAVHAIGDGHFESSVIRVRTWTEDGRVIAEVQDTGGGIAPEHRARIFEAFYTTKAAGIGSGLGLSICKSIVEGFGGEIGFTSEVGRGTAFRITLPAVRNDVVRSDSSVQAPASVETALRGRVLVVDDEPNVQIVLQRILGKEHELVLAGSGDEAQRIIDSDQDFDVVLCDVMMTRTSGVQLHRWMTEHHPNLARRLLFMTGGVFSHTESDYLDGVDNPCIEKPFESQKVKEAVRTAIAACRGHSAQRAGRSS